MTTGRNDRVSFSDHNERMCEFRRSHVSVELINEPRLDEAASLMRLHHLRAHQIQPQTGGEVFCSGVFGNEYMAPIWRVAPYRLSIN